MENKMNVDKNKIIKKMYNRISKKVLVPDRLDFEVILNYYCDIICKDVEISMSDPQQAKIYSEMGLSAEDAVMNYFRNTSGFSDSFEQLEDQLLFIASKIHNHLRSKTSEKEEDIPRFSDKPVRQIKMFGWVYFLKDDRGLRKRKCGKWMYFFADKYCAKKMCLKAVDENVVCEAKYTDDAKGVACFYLNIDDFEGHKKVIQFFLDNNLIKKTKAGKYTNISFKLDSQTGAKKYGKDFQGVLHLEDFIDLETGEFKNG